MKAFPDDCQHHAYGPRSPPIWSSGGVTHTAIQVPRCCSGQRLPFVQGHRRKDCPSLWFLQCSSEVCILQTTSADAHQAVPPCVFNACVLSLLLHGSECWMPLQHDLQKLSTFSMRCIRSILGVSRSLMWDEHITNEDLLVRWGDSETIKDNITHRRLEWLGHVAWMPDNRIPKQVLFGSFLQRRPAHGPRPRWKDCAVRDLRARGVEASWYDVACESHAEWHSTYQEPDNAPEPPPRVVCTVCGRDFARKGDMAREKCLEERARPASEQRGASQCRRCGWWLRSRGGLVRHVCVSTVDATVPPGAT